MWAKIWSGSREEIDAFIQSDLAFAKQEGEYETVVALYASEQQTWEKRYITSCRIAGPKQMFDRPVSRPRMNVWKVMFRSVCLVCFSSLYGGHKCKYHRTYFWEESELFRLLNSELYC